MRLVQLGCLMALIWAIAHTCHRQQTIQPTVEGPLSLGEELKIGILVSGEYFRETYHPQAIINAAYLLRDRINACGGVNQSPISIIVQETDGKAQEEMQAMQSLIEDHRVHGIIAYITNQYLDDFIDLAEQSPVPMLFPYAGYVEPSADPIPSSIYWGYTSPSAQQQAEALAQRIIAQGRPQLFLVTSDTEGGKMWATAIAQAYEAQGGQVINGDAPLLWSADNGSEANATGTDDIPSLNTLLSQENVAIAASLNQTDGNNFLNTLQSQRWASDRVPLFWQNQETLVAILKRMDEQAKEANPSLSELPSMAFSGISGVTAVSVGEGFQPFFENWQARLEPLPQRESANAWDATALFALAAQAAGQNSRTAIASELHSVANRPGTTTKDVCQGLEHLRKETPINFEGASGSVDLNRLGHVPGMFDVWQINQDGNIVVTEQINL